MKWVRPIALSVLLALAACEEEQAPAQPPIRAIKTFEVSDRAGEQSRQIAGITEAAVVTDLAFESSGRMTEITVDVGDTVAKDQVIAKLDPEPFNLRITSSRGQVVEAEAKLADADAKFKQQEDLYKQGFATKTAYDTALANRDSARSSLQVARSQLKLAERDLERAELTAPFDGSITAKHVERFTEVTPGQQIVQISADGNIKVNAAVPEGLVRRLQPGQTVSVSFPTLNDAMASGQITQIGARASSTNSFPVTVVLENNELPLRSGMTTEVTFRFKTEATGKAFLLPLSAVLPTTQSGNATVFVFDREAGVVREREVQVLNIAGNDLEVTGDLKEGDLVASAGVSFLVDGMKVKLLQAAAE